MHNTSCLAQVCIEIHAILRGMAPKRIPRLDRSTQQNAAQIHVKLANTHFIDTAGK
jgi:hypothetical protein